MDLAQRALHEHHKGDHSGHHDDHAQNHRSRDGTRTALGQELRQMAGNLGHDADKDDQRDAVADAAGRDLLAQPLQEHCATDKGDDHRGAEEHPGLMREIAVLKTDSQTPGLEERQQHRAITRILVDLFAALFALFFELLQRRHHRGQKLNDNRGRDIGHNSQGKYAHPPQRAAGEHGQDPADAGLGLIHEVAQRGAVDARHRYIGAEAIDDEKSEGEPDSLAQLGRLAERAPRQVRGHLFCG